MNVKILLILIFTFQLNGINYFSPFRYKTTCIDGKENYNCQCDPSSFWNSQGCISLALDSYIEIMQRENSLMSLSKVAMVFFPHNFVLSVWFRPKVWNGSFFSVYDELSSKINKIISIELSGLNNHYSNIIPSAAVKIRLGEMVYTFQAENIVKNSWNHLIWVQKVTSKSYRGQSIQWDMYLNGVTKTNTFDYQTIPSMQSNLVIVGLTKENKIYRGDIAHLNIWSRKEWENIAVNSSNEEKFKIIHEDKLQIHYGDVIEWANLRDNLLGDAKLVWNTEIWENEQNNIALLKSSCDQQCSKDLGPKCRTEAIENIVWPRIAAGSIARVKCPLFDHQDETGDIKSEISGYATRECVTIDDYTCEWKLPDINECLSPEIRNLEYFDVSRNATEQDTCSENWTKMMKRIEDLKKIILKNTVEFARLIKLFANAIELQRLSRYDCFDQERVPTYLDKIHEFADTLLSERYQRMWNSTIPAGESARELIMSLDSVYSQVMDYMQDQQVELKLSFYGFNFIFEMSNMLKETKVNGITMPTKENLYKKYNEKYIENNFADELVEKFTQKAAKIRLESNMFANSTKMVTAFAIHTSLPSLLKYVPKKFQLISTEDVPNLIKSVSSAIVHTRVSTTPNPLKTLEIEYASFWPSKMLDTRCASLIRDDKTNWEFEKCRLTKFDPENNIFKCECPINGVFAISGNINHDHINKLPPKEYLLSYISFFGCLISFLCAVSTLVLLLKFRTCSNTSSIHKNLAIAIAMGKFVFIAGINLTENKIVCQIMAASGQYFIAACSCWVLNESFNLYILITYAAHSNSTQTESSMIRHYFMGWVMPAIYVGAIFGAHSDDYLSTKYCWINEKYRWSLIVPPLSINMITILIMIFILKEHRERAYTKDEKANQAISIQSRAIWTQLVLLSGSWSFAFMLIMQNGLIIHFLYGFFSFIQGIFFIVFFFFLNDEIRADFHKSPKYLLEYVNVESSEEGEDDSHMVSIKRKLSMRYSSPNTANSTDKTSKKNEESLIIENSNINSSIRRIIHTDENDMTYELDVTGKSNMDPNVESVEKKITYL